MKLRIEELKVVHDMQTKYGPRTTVYITYDGQDYSYMSTKYPDENSKNWKVGMEIDVPVKENGKYRNIVFPKKQWMEAISIPPFPLVSIESQLVQIMEEILFIKKLLVQPMAKECCKQAVEEVPAPTDEDIPFDY